MFYVPGSPRDPKAIEQALLFVGTTGLATLLGLLLAGLAFIPRGRAWRSATLCVFAHVSYAILFGALSASTLWEGIYYIGLLAALLGTTIGLAELTLRAARRRGWPRGKAALALIVVVPCGALLVLVLAFLWPIAWGTITVE